MGLSFDMCFVIFYFEPYICKCDKARSKPEPFTGPKTIRPNFMIHLAYEKCNKTVPDNALVVDERDKDEIDKYKPDNHIVRNSKWPNRGGRTEGQVRQVCEDKIKNTKLAQECKKILGDELDFDAAIESCVENIKVSV